jgi:hypothetical protein
MKKLIAVILICLTVSGFSQVSFSKKAVSVNLGGNFGVYNTIVTDSLARAEGRTSEGKGVPVGLSLGVEYGVLNMLGVGIKGQTYHYISDPKDSLSVKGRDIAVLVNGHLIRKKKFDLIFGGTCGYSGINFTSSGYKKGVIKGGGLYYDLHLTPTLLFGKHFGMFFSIAYNGYVYKKLKVKDVDHNYTDHLTLKGSGPNYTLGFVFKFGGE